MKLFRFLKPAFYRAETEEDIQVHAIASTGNIIQFDEERIFNSLAAPGTGDITNNLTGARTGVVQKIYHNKLTAPTFPAGWVNIGTRIYQANTNNIIFCEWVSGTRVEYWIVNL